MAHSDDTSKNMKSISGKAEKPPEFRDASEGSVGYSQSSVNRHAIEWTPFERHDSTDWPTSDVDLATTKGPATVQTAEEKGQRAMSSKGRVRWRRWLAIIGAVLIFCVAV